MNLTDTHTHIYLPEFDNDRDEVVRRAIDAGLTKMVLPAVDDNSIEPMRVLHRRYPQLTAMSAGLHPTEVAGDYIRRLAIIEKELRSNRNDYVAIGEIGMDLYWDKKYAIQQADALHRQLLLAVELDMPVIIHCREALDETLDVFKSLERKPQAVFHSFSSGIADVRRIRAIVGDDTYFGINGVVTFKNCHVSEALAEIGLDHLLLETDAPYLAPAPHRGRRNEPAYIADTARFIATTLNIDCDSLANHTSANASRLFAL